MESARCLLVLAAAFSAGQLVSSASGDWDYESNGPDTWGYSYPTCNGSMQSPVDVRLEAVSSLWLPSLVFRGHWNSRVEATLTNNGHSAEVTLEKSTNPPTLRGGPLNDSYIFANLHFHWGANSTEGSEHVVDEHSYSMEAHVVHYNKRYGNVTNAYEYPDGICVVSFFLQVEPGYPNYQLSRLVAAVPHVVEPESSFPLPLSAATKWFHDRATAGEYLTYPGSLTTPPCSEAVTWIIYPEPVIISEEQVAVFRTMKSSSGSTLDANYRPTQPLNGRQVHIAVTKDVTGTLHHAGEGYVRA